MEQTKPLTDEELDEIEAAARSTLGDPRLEPLVEEPEVLRLIAEVRRLRAAAADPLERHAAFLRGFAQGHAGQSLQYTADLHITEKGEVFVLNEKLYVKGPGG